MKINDPEELAACADKNLCVSVAQWLNFFLLDPRYLRETKNSVGVSPFLNMQQLLFVHFP